MKRVFISVAALACCIVAEAQSAKDFEKICFVRDSVSEVLAEHRTNYAKNGSMRDSLKPTILALEKEVVRLQGECNKMLAMLSQEDIKSALEAYEKAKLQPKTLANAVAESLTEVKGDYIPDKARMKRDLVANDYFAERLSANDYKVLRDAQQRESKVKALVDKYSSEYRALLNLQRKYMEAPTREEADKVVEQFNTKSAQMVQLDGEITSMWSTLYYNKMYAYDLLMERSGNNAMLDLSATVTARAEREINENSDIYHSNALLGYYARKKVLTDYELQLASTLSQTTSRDSLKVVAAELKNRDYRISKLELQRRSFITYEELKVIKPTIYTPKNPIPHTKIYDFGTIYRIRIGLFANRPNLSLLKGITPLSYTDAYHNGLYAYFVGGFRTEQEALEGVAYLKKLGFKAPVVSVWVDGEYYSTVDDMRRSQSLYNVEISGVASLSEDMKSKILAHKSDCTISRIGSTFVVGVFEGKSLAESVAADLRAMGGDIEVKVTKKP